MKVDARRLAIDDLKLAMIIGFGVARAKWRSGGDLVAIACCTTDHEKLALQA
jgi:hypothetical protein